MGKIICNTLVLIWISLFYVKVRKNKVIIKIPKAIENYITQDNFSFSQVKTIKTQENRTITVTVIIPEEIIQLSYPALKNWIKEELKDDLKYIKFGAVYTITDKLLKLNSAL